MRKKVAEHVVFVAGCLAVCAMSWLAARATAPRRSHRTSRT
jgi:hypothetical protein